MTNGVHPGNNTETGLASSYFSVASCAQLLGVAVDRSGGGQLQLTAAQAGEGSSMDGRPACKARRGTAILRPAPLEEEDVPEFSFGPGDTTALLGLNISVYVCT
jgi:hypothetical protein